MIVRETDVPTIRHIRERDFPVIRKKECVKHNFDFPSKPEVEPPVFSLHWRIFFYRENHSYGMFYAVLSVIPLRFIPAVVNDEQKPEWNN